MLENRLYKIYWTNGETMTLKYYVYVSAAKLDMLYPQISEGKTRITTEIKSDLKLIGAAKKTEIELDPDRYSKVKKVTEHIMKVGDVGTVQFPGDWIAGELPMVTFAYEESNFVYFINPVEKTSSVQDVVALGGSAKHLMGAQTVSGSKSSLMYLQHLILGVDRDMQLDAGPAPLSQDDMVFRVLSYDAHIRAPHASAQSVEFLAKNLCCGETPSGNNVILATPLYVALTE